VKYPSLFVTSCSVSLFLLLLIMTANAFDIVLYENDGEMVASDEGAKWPTMKNAPVAAFSGIPTSGSNPLNVAFRDESTGDITSYIWNFGDGMTSSIRNPSHEYSTIGSYTVTLTVSGHGKSDFEIKTNYITVTNASTKIGVYKDGIWYLDWNGNGVYDIETDRVYSFGAPGWDPVVGDWNHDSKIDVGVTNGQQWYLDWNGNGTWDSSDKVYSFGAPGWSAVVGDWNGDYKTEIGVYQNGLWYLDYNGNGVFDTGDKVYVFGLPGWSAVVGDWNGNGTSKIGVYMDGGWYLDYNGNGIWDSGDKACLILAQKYTQPVVGDWNGNGKTKVGYYRWGFWSLDYLGEGTYSKYYLPFFGQNFDYESAPVVSDWNGDGKTEIGVYKDGVWYLDSSGDGVYGPGDRANSFGLLGWNSVVGKWS
jgi:hypothetical protein